jgi:nitrous oxidase accessory protein
MKVLNNAAPYDTVIIEQGEYCENLVIDKPVHIFGDKYPKITGGFKTNVILVQSNNTTIHGLHVSEAGTELIDDMACIRIEADSVTVVNNIITKPLHGIYVKGGNYTTIIGNKITGRPDLIEADRGNGIHLWNSNYNSLEDNEIVNVRDGIYFSFANHTIVHDNYIHHVRYGLHYMYSDDNSFTENIFENNVAGAALMYSKRIDFFNNIFARCRGFRAYGILYKSMDNTTANNNLIIDNSRGIFFDNCNYNHFNNNDVVDNDLALQVMGNGENNTILHNNFVNNLGDLVLDVKKTSTKWIDQAGGNYWTDYSGYDLNGDGLGDMPHTIQNVFQVLESDIPEIRLYLNSPSARILEIAERSLPILKLGTEKDSKPQMKPLINQKVPWSKVKILKASPNPLLAMLFIAMGCTIVFVLYRFGQFTRK